MAGLRVYNANQTLKTDFIFTDPTGNNTITVPNKNMTVAGLDDVQPPYRNRIINGAMNINQINGTTAVTPTIAGYISDQWAYTCPQASKLTFQQVADAPAGFKYSTKITVAAQYSPVAADNFLFYQPIEGQNIIDWQLGAAGAVTLVTSNWIKGSIAGTYSVVIFNTSGTRSYVGTINVTTSWTKVSITLVGDTAGTWTTDNTTGLFWGIDLGSGANFNTTAGVWQSGNFRRTSGSVTLVNQVAGSTLNITGVQFEKIPTGATQGTDFEWLPYDTELKRCERYYEALNATFMVSTPYPAGTTQFLYVPFKTTKRATAAHTIVSGNWVGVTPTVRSTTKDSITFSASGTTQFYYTDAATPLILTAQL